MTLSIRPTLATDIPAITRIYAHAVKHGTATFELEPPDEAEMLRRFEKLRTGGFPYIVAEIDGAVAGYAYAGAFRERPAYRFTVEDSIYLRPEALAFYGVDRAVVGNFVQVALNGEVVSQVVEGDVHVDRLERGWSWRIPLPGKMSVGLVIDGTGAWLPKPSPGGGGGGGGGGPPAC